MIDRRAFLGMTVGAGAALALTPELLRALRQSGGTLIQRAMPSSGEMLPVIGLGRGNDAVDPAAIRDVLRTFVDNGGKVVDTVHDTVGAGGQVEAATANELGAQSEIFWSLRGTPSGPQQPGSAGLYRFGLRHRCRRRRRNQPDRHIDGRFGSGDPGGYGAGRLVRLDPSVQEQGHESGRLQELHGDGHLHGQVS